MSFAPLLLAFLAMRGGKSERRKGTRHAPRWPRHPSARALVSRHRRAATHAHAHAPPPPPPPTHAATPADQTQAEERRTVHHDAHEPHAPVHHDSGTHLHELHQHHREPVDASAHVEQHHQAHKAHKTRPTSVAAVQKILVSLGWRGHKTTKGPLRVELTDGLYGPTTRDDWQQSAHKRGLATTFVRLAPKSVHVDARTYAALRRLADERGAVSGRIRLP